MTYLTTPDQKGHSYSADVKKMTDKQLDQLHQLIRKEVAHRYRTKHCEGMFTFDGKPMSKTQAIEAFVADKKKKEEGLTKVLKKLPADAQEYLKHMGDLHQHALRNKNEAGTKKMHDLMVEKLFEHHMADKAHKIIKRFYS